MLEKAITKLEYEMEKNKNNAYVQVVGDFLIQHVQINPGTAEKILNKDKTILKSLDAMKKAAEKKKVGNCAVLTDAEGFTIILKYFEINGHISAAPSSAPVVTPTVKEVPEIKSKKAFDVKLEDLI